MAALVNANTKVIRQGLSALRCGVADMKGWACAAV